jgi:hypothetical protein
VSTSLHKRMNVRTIAKRYMKSFPEDKIVLIGDTSFWLWHGGKGDDKESGKYCPSVWDVHITSTSPSKVVGRFISISPGYKEKEVSGDVHILAHNGKKRKMYNLHVNERDDLHTKDVDGVLVQHIDQIYAAIRTEMRLLESMTDDVSISKYEELEERYHILYM